MIINCICYLTFVQVLSSHILTLMQFVIDFVYQMFQKQTELHICICMLGLSIFVSFCDLWYCILFFVLDVQYIPSSSTICIGPQVDYSFLICFFVVSGRLHSNSKSHNSCHRRYFIMSHNGIINHESEMHRIFVWSGKKAVKR
jgi:hypothetical protein